MEVEVIKFRSVKPKLGVIEEAAMRAMSGLPPSDPLSDEQLAELRRHPNERVRCFFQMLRVPV